MIQREKKSHRSHFGWHVKKCCSLCSCKEGESHERYCTDSYYSSKQILLKSRISNTSDYIVPRNDTERKNSHQSH